MATVQSVSYKTENIGGWDSISIDKPTGLSVGDLMVACVGCQFNGTIATPTGWTLITSSGWTSGSQTRSWYKVATSDDVSASSFGFQNPSRGNTVTMSGGILRISGIMSPYVESAATGTSASNVTTITNSAVDPTDTNSIIVFAGIHNGTAGTSNYACATSNPTWTEVMDETVLNTLNYFIAYATRPETTSTGNITATKNSGKFGSMAFVIYPGDDHEQVHHINGIKDDNRIENLALMTQKVHMGEVECPHCKNHFFIK